jgi:acyl carrier protein
MTEIEESLLAVFERIFNLHIVDISTVSMNNLEEWDSIKHISLILEIEDTFNITIDPDYFMTMDSFNNTFKVVELVLNSGK